MSKIVVILIGILVLIGAYLVFPLSIYKHSPITKNDAEDMVKTLPEVRNRLQNAESEWIVNAEDRKDDYWYVQVAEVVEDIHSEDKERVGHTATFNWYKILKKNGEISCSMFAYDKTGKLLQSNEADSCI
jgi:hypothetical protein